jgi:hypothetical protein
MCTKNTLNESVCLLRIRGMNLLVCCKSAEQICTYTENTPNARKVEYFGELKPVYSHPRVFKIKDTGNLKISSLDLGTVQMVISRKRDYTL